MQGSAGATDRPTGSATASGKIVPVKSSHPPALIHRFIISILLTSLPASAGHYEVYLLAGQSNAGGHGYVSREFSLFSPNGDDGLAEMGKTQYLQSQPDAIFIHWRGGTPSAARPTFWDARSDGWIPMKAGYSLFNYNSSSPASLGAEIANHPFGAEVTFAKRMREGRPGRKIAVIKYSQGATSLGSAGSPGAWDPVTGRAYNINTYANAGHCYAGLLQLVSSSLQTLTQQGHTYELRGMIWHQGESDSGLSTAVYKDRLKEFIAAIRNDLGKPQLPFLIGEIIQSGSRPTALPSILTLPVSSTSVAVTQSACSNSASPCAARPAIGDSMNPPWRGPTPNTAVSSIR